MHVYAFMFKIKLTRKMQRTVWRQHHKKGGATMGQMDMMENGNVAIHWVKKLCGCCCLDESHRFLPKSSKRRICREASWPCSQITSSHSVSTLYLVYRTPVIQTMWIGTVPDRQALCRAHYSYLSHNFPNCPFMIPFYRWGYFNPQRLSDLSQLCNEEMADSLDSPQL